MQAESPTTRRRKIRARMEARRHLDMLSWCGCIARVPMALEVDDGQSGVARVRLAVVVEGRDVGRVLARMVGWGRSATATEASVQPERQRGRVSRHQEKGEDIPSRRSTASSTKALLRAERVSMNAEEVSRRSAAQLAGDVPPLASPAVLQRSAPLPRARRPHANERHTHSRKRPKTIARHTAPARDSPRRVHQRTRPLKKSMTGTSQKWSVDHLRGRQNH